MISIYLWAFLYYNKMRLVIIMVFINQHLAICPRLCCCFFSQLNKAFMQIYQYIYIKFSKHAFNEFLQLFIASWWYKFDWQLPSSLAHATRLEHRTHWPEVTLVTANHYQVSRVKEAI